MAENSRKSFKKSVRNVTKKLFSKNKDKKNKEDFLEVIEEYDNYDDGNNKLPDYDVIN